MDKNYIKFKAVYEWNDEEKMYMANVPGFDNIFTMAETIDKLEEYLVDIMTLTILDFEDERESPEEAFKINRDFTGDNIIYISFFLPYERSLTKEAYRKKTLTIPAWLETLARQKNINFSEVLRNGLKKELNIE